jgi:hypothetical protein
VNLAHQITVPILALGGELEQDPALWAYRTAHDFERTALEFAQPDLLARPLMLLTAMPAHGTLQPWKPAARLRATALGIDGSVSAHLANGLTRTISREAGSDQLASSADCATLSGASTAGRAV